MIMEIKMKKFLLKMCFVLVSGAVTLPLAGQLVPLSADPVPVAPATPAVSSTPATPEQAAPVVTDVPIKGKYKIRKVFAEVISAEISGSKKPQVTHEDIYDKTPFGDKTCWAQIILMLPEKRGLSRFDFVLKSGSETYPCLAVAIGDTPYSMKEDSWILPEQRDVNVPVRLLFAVSEKQIAGKDVKSPVKLNLERVLSGVQSKIGADVLNFRLMPSDKEFSTAAEAQKFAVERGGSYGMTYEEMIKPPQPEPAPAPAPAAGTTPAPAPAPAAPATTSGPLVK